MDSFPMYGEHYGGLGSSLTIEPVRGYAAAVPTGLAQTTGFETTGLAYEIPSTQKSSTHKRGLRKVGIDGKPKTPRRREFKGRAGSR